MQQRYMHLSPEERDVISHLSGKGVSLRTIALKLNRSASSIAREIQRNKSPMYNVYLAHRAQQRATERKRNAHRRPRLKTKAIRRSVTRKLKQGWSPEQIAGRMKIANPPLSISHEAIYQFLYDRDLRRLEDLVPYLPRAHKNRQRKGHRHTHKSSHIPFRIGINERPTHIHNRKQFGHWETDAMISRQSTAALNVTVERKSRFTKITKMKQKSAHRTRCALTRALSRFPPHARQTITYDNGSENVHHYRTNSVLGTRSYFCNQYHSWERGTNENTIGLVRRFFPKKTNFQLVSNRDIKKVERLLNNRPRKCLSFKTPLEVFRRCCT